MSARNVHRLAKRMRWAARVIGLIVTIFGGTMLIGETISEFLSQGFVTTLLLYPHWLFAVLGIPGTAILYLSTKEEDKNLVQQFGDDYLAYMKRVPRMNIFLGIFRILLSREQ